MGAFSERFNEDGEFGPSKSTIMLRETKRSVLLWVLFKERLQPEEVHAESVNQCPAWLLHADNWNSSVSLDVYTPCYCLSTTLGAVCGQPLQHQRGQTHWEGRDSPWNVTRGHSWDRGDPRPSLGFSQSPASCGSFCFGKDHSEVTVKLHTPPLLHLGSVYCSCVHHKVQWPLELLWICIFFSKNEWLTFMTRSCLSTDWLNLIILSSNRSKALI